VRVATAGSVGSFSGLVSSFSGLVDGRRAVVAAASGWCPLEPPIRRTTL
jgi:hypothetical protein